MLPAYIVLIALPVGIIALSVAVFVLSRRREEK